MYIYILTMYQRQHQWQPCAEYVQHELPNLKIKQIYIYIIERERIVAAAAADDEKDNCAVCDDVVMG